MSARCLEEWKMQHQQLHINEIPDRVKIMYKVIPNCFSLKYVYFNKDGSNSRESKETSSVGIAYTILSYIAYCHCPSFSSTLKHPWCSAGVSWAQMHKY